MAQKASNDALASLHDKMAEVMADQLENGVKVLTKDGQVEVIPPNAALLNVVRQFLRDNGVEVDPEQPSEPMVNLGTAMKQLNDEDDGLPEFAVH